MKGPRIKEGAEWHGVDLLSLSTKRLLFFFLLHISDANQLQQQVLT